VPPSQPATILTGGLLSCCYTSLLLADDAVKVDPKHYAVVTDNDRVRILKAHYGLHDKSVMRSHPAAVAVFLTDGTGKFTFPDGKAQDFTGRRVMRCTTPRRLIFRKTPAIRPSTWS
jgi:hypothetical protein